jgi:hypothetical protein
VLASLYHHVVNTRSRKIRGDRDACEIVEALLTTGVDNRPRPVSVAASESLIAARTASDELFSIHCLQLIIPQPHRYTETYTLQHSRFYLVRGTYLLMGKLFVYEF